MINASVKDDAVLRLRKIEGQVKGIQKMVEEEKYCIDIVNQITAVRRALEGVGLIVMKRHIESCVAESIKRDKSGEKVKELMETIDRFVK